MTLALDVAEGSVRHVLTKPPPCPFIAFICWTPKTFSDYRHPVILAELYIAWTSFNKIKSVGVGVADIVSHGKQPNGGSLAEEEAYTQHKVIPR